MVSEQKEKTISLPPRPKRVCPICGKTWLLYCREDEWGYGSRDSLQPTKENRLTLFCSRPCMDEFSRRLQAERAERLMQTRAFKVWWMYDQQYMTEGDIARAEGLRAKAVDQMIREVERKHWRDLDWILAQ